MKSLVLTPGVELLSSMRSIGYSFEAAVADLIDNSLAASAKNIWIKADLQHCSYLYVLDDGTGMDSGEALEALRLAGTANKSRSDKKDLGRFGLGLKTASLSQARRITLITKQGDSISGLAWDIDHIGVTQQWEILSLSAQEISKLPGARELQKLDSGTVVLWQNLDYLIGKAQKPTTHLSEKLRSLEQHLGFVFHRFLLGALKTESVGAKKSFELPITIKINNQEVSPIDPFLSDSVKTQRTPVSTIEVDGVTVEIQGFTLPHQKYLTASQAVRFDLNKNMRDYQGFYIFRNNRLISWGQWFNLVRKEELYKQSRVSVDISSELDGLWQIDIRKSRSEPPYEFKEKLRPVLENIVGKSKRIHTFRGRKENSQEIHHYWTKIKKGKEVRYEINEEHPLVSSIKSSLPPNEKKHLELLLKDIVATAPFNDIYVEKASNSHIVNNDLSDAEYVNKIKSLLELHVLTADVGLIVQKLSAVEPFSLITRPGKLEALAKKAIK